MEFLILRCWQDDCPATFHTANERSTHHVDAHALPLDPTRTGEWTISPSQTRYQPPYHRHAGQRVFATNGATP